MNKWIDGRTVGGGCREWMVGWERKRKREEGRKGGREGGIETRIYGQTFKDFSFFSLLRHSKSHLLSVLGMTIWSSQIQTETNEGLIRKLAQTSGLW